MKILPTGSSNPNQGHSFYDSSTGTMYHNVPKDWRPDGYDGTGRGLLQDYYDQLVAQSNNVDAELKAATHSTEVAEARRRGLHLASDMQGQMERQQSRYLGGMTEAQKQQLGRDIKSEAELAKIDMQDTARQVQMERNQKAYGAMQNTALALANQGIRDMGSYNQMDISRMTTINNYNERQRQADENANDSMLSNVLGLGGAVIGGVVTGGNPAGAAVGSGIGSTVANIFNR